MKKILILFAHPALEKSRVNKILISGIKDLDGVTFHDLYESYPEFDIDVKYEQQLLIANDIIIFQHPFFWYSIPAIMKEWMDLVLEHGWAYGSNGDALNDKLFFNVVTTGGREEAYQEEGYNRFTINQFLAPIQQTAYLCKMKYLSPYAIHGTHKITSEEIKFHIDEYKLLLTLLRDEKIDLVRSDRFKNLATNVLKLKKD